MAHRPGATERELRPEEVELRHRPGVERAYFGDDFVVTWEPALCVHSARCFRSLPRVFRPWERPWVHVDEATDEQIEAVVATCPLGALKFERLDPEGASPEDDESGAGPAGGPEA